MSTANPDNVSARPTPRRWAGLDGPMPSADARGIGLDDVEHALSEGSHQPLGISRADVAAHAGEASGPLNGV